MSPFALSQDIYERSPTFDDTRQQTRRMAIVCHNTVATKATLSNAEPKRARQPSLSQPDPPVAPPRPIVTKTDPISETSTTTTYNCVDTSQTDNEPVRELVKRYIAEIWNCGEVDLIPQLCSPHLRFSGTGGPTTLEGHQGLTRMVQSIRRSLEDYHAEICSMVVENNKAFCRLNFTGKHVGTLMGYEATNKKVHWIGTTEFTCRNGQISAVWELGDTKALLEQIDPEFW